MQVDICMLLDKPADNDSRVLREAKALQDAGWRIMILSYSTQHSQNQLGKINSVDVLEVPVPSNQVNQIMDALLKIISYILVSLSFIFPKKAPKGFLWLFLRTTRLWDSKYRTGIQALHNISTTFIHAHDYLTLPVPFATFDNPQVIYDSHELYFEQYQPAMSAIKKSLTERKRQLESQLEYQLVQKCQAVITVSEDIAIHMQKQMNIKKVYEVRNLVDLPSSPPEVNYETVGKITIVHVGYLVEGRQLDVLIKAFQYLPDNIVLVLMGKGALTEKLKQLAKSLGLEARVKFFPPVSPEKVADTIVQADISAVINPHGKLNREYAYPQKMLESIAAGLPLITTDTVSILKLVNQYDLGLIVDPTDEKSIAQAIEKMTEAKTFEYYKEKVKIARETLNWEHEQKRLTDLYKTLKENL